MSETKLTTAQDNLLRELPTHVVPLYKPAQKLIELGLAEWADARTTLLNPTPAGSARVRKEPTP
jgi:hypothetical protein